MFKGLILVLSALVFVGCGSDGDQSPPSTSAPVQTEEAHPIARGLWGGQGISLIVNGDSSTFVLDCAHGTVDDPIMINRVGMFTARGTVTIEHGGPEHPGEQLPTFESSFDGVVAGGDQMHLRISYEVDGQPRMTDYTLKYRAQPTLHKCL